MPASDEYPHSALRPSLSHAHRGKKGSEAVDGGGHAAQVAIRAPSTARTDAGALRELYGRYAERVLGYHLRRRRDEDAAHELTAETFGIART